MAMRRQERKNAVRLQKMTRYRFCIEQLSLIIRSTLHPEIIPNNTDQQTDRHAELFRTLPGLDAAQSECWKSLAIPARSFDVAKHRDDRELRGEHARSGL